MFWIVENILVLNLFAHNDIILALSWNVKINLNSNRLGFAWQEITLLVCLEYKFTILNFYLFG